MDIEEKYRRERARSTRRRKALKEANRVIAMLKGKMREQALTHKLRVQRLREKVRKLEEAGKGQVVGS